MPGTRRAKCKRNQQRGGGLGSTYGLSTGSWGGDGTVANPVAWTRASSCVAETRPGFMPDGYTGPKGLPGMSVMSSMSGGKRSSKKSSKRSSSRSSRSSRKSYKKQSGGRYGFDGSDMSGMGTPWGSGRAADVHMPCEASRSAIPDSGAADMLNKVGGPLWDGPVPGQSGRGQQGGANPAIANAADSAVYEVPTAGYTHLRTGADSIQTSAGTLEMINVPENARVMSAACLKTGGSRKSRKSRKQKKSKKSRKSRKSQ